MSGFAVVIPVEGDVALVDWPDDDDAQLRLLHEKCDTDMVEPVVRSASRNVGLFVDEDGHPKQLTHNPRASYVAGAALVGNAMITGWDLSESIPGLDREQAEEIKRELEA